jgi:3-hydroxybutyryl-CoA dehydrogenase
MYISGVLNCRLPKFILVYKVENTKMDNNKIKNITIIGAGLMGSQLAELFARVGKYDITMWDINDKLVDEGLKSIQTRLRKHFVEKGKISESEFQEICVRIKPSINLEAAAKSADFVLEAVIENLDIKRKIFEQLSVSGSPHTILASNTSYLNITEIGSHTTRQDKVVGMHFFNPVSIMKLVEVVRGTFTSDETTQFVCDLAKMLGKEPVICHDFSFAFLANRAYLAMTAEAVQMVWEHVASPQDIDKALKLGYNLPMGPLELSDFTGGWGLRAASEPERMKELGPEKGRLHPLIKMMVRAGYTGGKTGKGIYAFWDEVMKKW